MDDFFFNPRNFFSYLSKPLLQDSFYRQLPHLKDLDGKVNKKLISRKKSILNNNNNLLRAMKGTVFEVVSHN